MDEQSSMTATATDTARAAEDTVREYVFKVVVIGDYNVGKTTLLKRLLTMPFHRSAASLIGSDEDAEDTSSNSVTDNAADEDELRVVPTVGVDFYARVLRRVRPEVNLRLQLWDTAGLEQYAAVQAGTYRHASLLLCVYDVTRRASLQNLLHHHLAAAAEHLPELAQGNIFVVGNKTDLRAPAEAAALRRNDHRSRHPEAAFVDDTDTDLTSAATDGRRDADDDAAAAAASPHGTAGSGSGGAAATTTVASRVRLAEQMVHESQVQELLLDDLPEVHYSEVSALRRSGVAQLLESMVAYLLKTQVDTTVTEAHHTATGRTTATTQAAKQPYEHGQTQPARPSQRLTASAAHGADTVLSDDKRADAGKDDRQHEGGPQQGELGQPDAAAAPAALPATQPSSTSAAARAASRTTPTSEKATAGSWRNGGLSFDLVSSPHSPGPTGANTAQARSSDVNSPLYSPQEATHTATPRTGEQDADDERATVLVARSRAEQERAEMQQLLARRGRRATQPAEAPSGADATSVPTNRLELAPHEQVDIMPTGAITINVANRPHALDTQDVAPPAPCPSGQEDGDEDGTAFRKRIQDRYSAIEKQRDEQQQAGSKQMMHDSEGAPQAPPPPINVAAQYKKQKQKCNCRCHP